MIRRDGGFTLLEAVVSLALTLTVTGAAMSLVGPDTMAARVQLDAADVQQRLRVSIEALMRDLRSAGAGMTSGPSRGQLSAYLPAVLPARIGLQNADPVGTARADALTITYVPITNAQGVTAMPVPQGNAFLVSPAAYCPAGQIMCGFQPGMSAIVFDGQTHFDVFSVTQVQNTSAQWQPHGAGSGYLYPAGVPVSEIRSRTYYFDAAASQLRQYDGYQTDVPIADNIVSATFEYAGDPQPPVAPRPPLGIANCLYDAAGNHAPMAVLGPGDVSVTLPLAMLSDGPWCGSGASRFDADLLRVRTIRVSLRVQAASAGDRTTGAAFAKSGTSRESLHLVPDALTTFVVAPRNLNGGR